MPENRARTTNAAVEKDLFNGDSNTRQFSPTYEVDSTGTPVERTKEKLWCI